MLLADQLVQPTHTGIECRLAENEHHPAPVNGYFPNAIRVHDKAGKATFKTNSA